MALIKKTGEAPQEFKGNDRPMHVEMSEAQIASYSVDEPKTPLNGPMIGGLMHDAAQITNALVMAHGYKEPAIVLQNFEAILKGLLDIREKLEK